MIGAHPPSRRTAIQFAAFSALMLFVFTIPWEDSLLLPGFGTVGRFTGLIAVATGALSILSRNGVVVRRPAAYLLPFAVFALWTCLTLLWSLDLSRGIGYASTMVQLCIMGWLFYQLCRTGRDRARLMQAYVLGSLVSVTNTMIQYTAGNTFAPETTGRFAASGFNPNYLASGLALAIPMAWYLATTAEVRWQRALNYLAILGLLVAILLTGSRGGFITAALALTVVPLTYTRLRPRTQISLVATLAILSYVLYAMSPTMSDSALLRTSRFQEIPEQLSSGDLTGRGEIWIAGLEMFRDNVWLGVGAGSFPTAIEPYLGKSKTAHNAFLNVAAQSGLPGLILFCAAIGTVILPFLRVRLDDRLIYLALLATVLVSLAPSTMENGKEIWFVMALAASRSAVLLVRDSRYELMGRPSAISGTR